MQEVQQEVPCYRNDVITDLMIFTYGQKGVVALPGGRLPSTIGEGEYPAGVNDLLNYLYNEYSEWARNDSTSRNIDWLFLVGGPGNGKSQALTTFAEILGLSLPPVNANQQAPRVVPQSWPSSGFQVHGNLEVLLINDASIPRAGIVQGTGGSLFQDLRDACQRSISTPQHPTAIFANINRGILIEESHSLPQSTADIPTKVASETIGWLSNPKTALNASISIGNSPIGQISITPEAHSPYYGQLAFRTSSTGFPNDIIVHAVFLDTLSLLEPMPSAGGSGPTVDFSSTLPQLARYTPVGGLTPQPSCRKTTIAGERVSSIVKESNWQNGGCLSTTGAEGQSSLLCEAHEYCPFFANASWLRDPTLMDNFLATMRAAEIASTRRFTYRDVMEHLALCILGRLEEDWLRGIHPCEWVESLHREIVQNSSTKSQAVYNLLRHRIYFNLFSTTDGGVWTDFGPEKLTAPLHGSIRADRLSLASAERPRAFELGFNRIDPAKDSGTWRQAIIDSVDSLEIELPSVLLSNRGILTANASGRLEELVDQLLVDELAAQHAGTSGTDATRRRVLRHWRCVLLLRQVGLATNNVAFRDVIESWLQEHAAALNDIAPITDIGSGLRSLVLQPTRLSGVDQLVLAPLRPRTYALKSIPPGTIVVVLNPSLLQILPVAEGDTLLAEVRMLVGNRFEEVTTFPVDLSIAREAAMQALSPGTGFTEIGPSSFARIERTRAALLSREKMSRHNPVFMGSNGQVRTVRPNPSGSVPFQVT